MAETVTGQISPSLAGGEGYYQFTLDGIATSSQMDKLLNLTKDLVKKIVGNSADSLKNLDKSASNASESLSKASTSAAELHEATKDLSQGFNDSLYTIRNVLRRDFTTAIGETSKSLSTFSFAVGFAYTGLNEYSKSLSEGLKRGVSGSTFDFGIAAKNAGISISTFAKTLKDTGGGFVSLGDNATDGARQFGRLIKNVRLTTDTVGNLGMNNEELAQFTAEQTKIVIAQGFKGKQAQDVIIRNSRDLGTELDNLAARTGKSTLELAKAASKLAQDPIVSTFVKTARAGSEKISTAVNTFAASLAGIFGEEGEKLAKDILQTSLAGLPLVITQTGKNMILASNNMYGELEKLGAKVRNGGKVEEEDRQRLRDIALKEVKERGDQLRQFAQLGGAAGESANQILKLAQEAEFYAGPLGKEQRRQTDAAKRFNSELNKLQATLQEAFIPLLHALNSIDWGTVFNVVSYIPRKISEFIDSIGSMFDSLGLGKLFGGENGIGEIFSKLAGGFVGITTTLGLVATAMFVFKKTLGAITGVFGGLSKEIGVNTSKYGILGKALDTFGESVRRAIGTGLGGKGSPDSPIAGGRGQSRPSIILGPDGRPIMVPQTPIGTISSTGSRGRLSRVGEKMMSPKGIGLGLAAGIGLDTAANVAKESGQESLGKALDVGSSIVGMAGTGAMIGSMIAPGVGTAVGAALGGLVGGMTSIWQNYLKDEQSSISKSISKGQESANDDIAAYRRQQRENDQKMIQQLTGLTELFSYNVSVTAAVAGNSAETARAIKNTQYQP